MADPPPWQPPYDALLRQHLSVRGCIAANGRRRSCLPCRAHRAAHLQSYRQSLQRTHDAHTMQPRTHREGERRRGTITSVGTTRGTVCVTMVSCNRSHSHRPALSSSLSVLCEFSTLFCRCAIQCASLLLLLLSAVCCLLLSQYIMYYSQDVFWNEMPTTSSTLITA